MSSTRYKLLVSFWLAFLWNHALRILIPVLLPDIQSSLSLSIGFAGAIPGAVFLGYAVSNYPSGILSERIGRGRMILSGLILTTTCIFILSLLESYPLILAAALFIGIGLGTYLPSAISLVSEHFAERKGTALGFHDTGAMIGRFIGPISAGLMLAALGWQGIIRLWIIPSTILIGMLLIFKIDGKKIIPVERGSVAVKWSKSSYLYIAMTFVGVITASSGFLSLIPLYMAREFGMAPPLIAFIIGGTQLLGLFGAIIGGALSDVIGRFKILFTAMTVNVASIAVITYTPYGSLFLTGLIGLSVTISTFFAVIGATISDVTEMHETARRFGFIHAIGQIFGSGVSTVVIGFLAEYFGFQNAFVYPIFLGSAGCICLPMFFRSLNSKN